MIFLDTETCGFTGPIVLIQMAKDDGPVQLIHVWRIPIRDSLLLIRDICKHEVVGFNLTFDWFKLIQWYNCFINAPNQDLRPVDYTVEEIKKWRSCYFLKPKAMCDLMLHAQTTHYQSLMDRDDIRIKRVPKQAANDLIKLLNDNIQFPDIFFAKYADPTQRFKYKNGDIYLKFAPSMALKSICKDLGLLREGRNVFADVLPKIMPEERGYDPFYCKWDKRIIIHHIWHWKQAIPSQYATDDVLDTRNLYRGEPFDSQLCAMVANCRYKGFAVDKAKLQKIVDDADAIPRPCNINSAQEVFTYVSNGIEHLFYKDGRITTSKKVLKAVSQMREAVLCEKCDGGCEFCDEGIIEGELTENAKRAKMILDARKASKQKELLQKLIDAGRFYASFKIIGALSGRMSGTDGLNAQGINSDKKIRECFPLKDEGEILCGGDFSAFEVAIMESVYDDPVLTQEMERGDKIHAHFGAYVYDKTYDEIMADDVLYKNAKQGVFLIAYGGQEHTLQQNLGLTKEQAKKAYEFWYGKYISFPKVRGALEQQLCPITDNFEWREPIDYIETMTGFKRYYTLENKILKGLYQLEFDFGNEKVIRSKEKGPQTLTNAVRSAIFGAMFGIQSSSVRTAMNHRIQGTGGWLTKKLQERLWELQPVGIFKPIISQMQVHDEILAVCKDINVADEATKIVKDFIAEYRSLVRLLDMEWKVNINNWAEK